MQENGKPQNLVDISVVYRLYRKAHQSQLIYMNLCHSGVYNTSENFHLVRLHAPLSCLFISSNMQTNKLKREERGVCTALLNSCLQTAVLAFSTTSFVYLEDLLLTWVHICKIQIQCLKHLLLQQAHLAESALNRSVCVCISAPQTICTCGN